MEIPQLGNWNYTQILPQVYILPLGMVLLVDGIIVIISAIAFPPDTVMYSILSLGVVSLTIDSIRTLIHHENLLIISQNSEQI